MVRRIIQELLCSLIGESESPYGNFILLIKNKTGNHRLCIDYCKLHAVIVKNKHPLSLIEDQIDRLHRNRYFTTLDLASGYPIYPI